MEKIKENNKMGKTSDLFKKTEDNKQRTRWNHVRPYYGVGNVGEPYNNVNISQEYVTC